MSRRAKKTKYQPLHSFGLALSTPQKSGHSGESRVTDTTSQANSPSMVTQTRSKTLARSTSSTSSSGDKESTKSSPPGTLSHTPRNSNEPGNQQGESDLNPVSPETVNSEKNCEMTKNADDFTSPDRSRGQLSFWFDPLSQSQRVLIHEKDSGDSKAISDGLNRMFLCMHENRVHLEALGIEMRISKFR